MATSKGHMHQTDKNINSTKKQEPKKLDEPLMKPMAQCTNKLLTKMIDHTRKIETYLTAKFPVTSNRGNRYLFVFFEFNRNIILIIPMKERLDIKLIRVFKDLH